MFFFLVFIKQEVIIHVPIKSILQYINPIHYIGFKLYQRFNVKHLHSIYEIKIFYNFCSYNIKIKTNYQLLLIRYENSNRCNLGCWVTIRPV